MIGRSFSRVLPMVNRLYSNKSVAINAVVRTVLVKIDRTDLSVKHHLRLHPVVEAYVETDAANSTGCGGALGDHPEESSLPRMD